MRLSRDADARSRLRWRRPDLATGAERGGGAKLPMLLGGAPITSGRSLRTALTGRFANHAQVLDAELPPALTRTFDFRPF